MMSRSRVAAAAVALALSVAVLGVGGGAEAATPRSDAAGTADCAVTGKARFTPGVTNTPASTVWSFAGSFVLERHDRRPGGDGHLREPQDSSAAVPWPGCHNSGRHPVTELGPPPRMPPGIATRGQPAPSVAPVRQVLRQKALGTAVTRDRLRGTTGGCSPRALDDQ